MNDVFHAILMIPLMMYAQEPGTISEDLKLLLRM